MHVAVALELRVHRALQPSTERDVVNLLARCILMDRAGGLSRERCHEAADGSATAPRRLTIGIHVRRGDACETLDSRAVHGATNLQAERRCYALDDYLGAAHALRRLYGAKRVLLLTDSASVLLQLQRLPHARAFDWQWLDLDRARIGGDGRQNLHVPPGRRVYIDACADHVQRSRTTNICPSGDPPHLGENEADARRWVANISRAKSSTPFDHFGGIT